MNPIYRVLLAFLFLNTAIAYAVDPKSESVKPGVAGGATEIAQGPEASEVPNKIYLVSWGDLIFFFGPETDPALNTKEQIARMITEWKRRGCTHVFWRTEAEDPLFKLNESTINAEGSFVMSEVHRLNAQLDTTAIARQICRELGLQFYIWHSLYDDGTPADQEHRFWKTGFPWRNTFFDDHAELEVRDRKGNVQWGIREMAYPLAREQKIDQYIERVRKYRPDGVFFYLHSHSAAGFHGDQFGFNEPIVKEFKKRYGIDILTDPRFDYLNPDFDPHDIMVEKWRALRGEYLTTFFREAKAALHKVDPDLSIAINTQGGDWFGPPFGNMKTDWRTWVKEDLADILLLRTWMAGGMGAYDFHKEGYLTWADGGVGTIPYPEIRKEVERSGNDILVISRERSVLDGTDGYFDASARLDLAYSRRQRQEQLAEVMNRDGIIHFIAQDFEDVQPLDEKGFPDFTFHGKRYFIGSGRYRASTNMSPGFAGPISGDPKLSPTLVNLSNTGREGMGVRLADPEIPLIIHRRTGKDFPDDPIDAGRAIASVDIRRGHEAAVDIGIRNRGDQRPEQPQIRIAENGGVFVANDGSGGDAVGQLGEEIWASLQVEMDFDVHTWTLSLDGKPLATRPLDPAKGSFDSLGFDVKEGEATIDNIRVDWVWDDSKPEGTEQAN